MTIIGDGEIALDEVPILDVEDKCVRLAVADKLLLKPKPERTCHWVEHRGDLDEPGATMW